MKEKGISPEMSVRLCEAFGRTPEGWLALQAAYDLAQIAKAAASIDVKPLFEHGNSLVLSDTEEPFWYLDIPSDHLEKTHAERLHQDSEHGRERCLTRS